MVARNCATFAGEPLQFWGAEAGFAVGGLIVLSNLGELMATNWVPFIPEYDPAANNGEGAFGIDGIRRAASIVRSIRTLRAWRCASRRTRWSCPAA